MKAGTYFYGLATALFGILDLIWGQFEGSHQPVEALGAHVAGLHFLAYLCGVLMIVAGVAILLNRTARFGALACGIIYLAFTALWLIRFYTAVHTLGLHFNIVLGLLFMVGQELFLIAPAAIVYIGATPQHEEWQRKVMIAVRWMLGLPPVFFGLDHLIGIRFFATIVPHWMPFSIAWTAITGVAFLLSGIAICSGRLDILTARLLALMLLVFEFLVEIPPCFTRLHSQDAWGAAVYNLAAIGAIWLFAEWVASPSTANSHETGRAEHLNLAQPSKSFATGS